MDFRGYNHENVTEKCIKSPGEVMLCKDGIHDDGSAVAPNGAGTSCSGPSIPSTPTATSSTT
jgi:hypothetical protein